MLGFPTPLTHEAAKAAEDARNPHLRMDFNENVLCGVDVDLQHARFVERAVQEHQQALPDSASGRPCAHLMSDVRPQIDAVTIVFLQDMRMIRRVQQLICFSHLW
jgi:hypothetical protein